MASHGNDFTSHYHKFTIKKVLTQDDVQPGTDFITLINEDVVKQICSYRSPDIKLLIQDVDTNSDHEVYFHSYTRYAITFYGLWRSNFIDRRSLSAGDEIGFYYNPNSTKLCFSVLVGSGSCYVLGLGIQQPGPFCGRLRSLGSTCIMGAIIVLKLRNDNHREEFESERALERDIAYCVVPCYHVLFALQPLVVGLWKVWTMEPPIIAVLLFY
ncbi:hypothetical protein Dsin_015890 [Dipteronia sinensis]|uniref:TF-B3 domain-containing protein n=1 Tax=Dipteronia sinensis TaxID=43782 RepID=A0AAE0ACD2_9ROSI|nr:hypothetical protein Dsin_015890 [Dipteronia sinensis]